MASSKQCLSWSQYVDKLFGAPSNVSAEDDQSNYGTKLVSSLDDSLFTELIDSSPGSIVPKWSAELTEAALLLGTPPPNSQDISSTATIASPIAPTTLEDIDIESVNWVPQSVTVGAASYPSPRGESFESSSSMNDFVYTLLDIDVTTPLDSNLRHSESSRSTGGSSTRNAKRLAKQCSAQFCQNRVRSRGLCKTHGGGKRCISPGCTTCSVGGVYCIRHGGGKKCGVRDCQNVVQSRGMCKAHGGGARCTVLGCSKSSQGRGLCTSHGGGRRCSIDGCGKGAQSKGKCYSHGRMSM